MWSDESFSDQSYSRDSWLISALASVRREVVRMASAIWRVVTLQSRL